jgi:thioredoxin reductase (NADPH)
MLQQTTVTASRRPRVRSSPPRRSASSTQSPEQVRLPFETTVPGVFALGDVRSGSVKRVAAAVGEGSAAVQHVMRYRERIAERGHAESDGATGDPLPVGASHNRP